ncbi:Long chain base biosynthesis protein 1c, partial [Clarias magur]
SCRAQVHCQSSHRHQPDTERESEEVLQGQEIQASGPEAQEDSRYPPAAHQARGGPHDQEDAKEVAYLLHAQICCQGLRLFLLNKRPIPGQR